MRADNENLTIEQFKAGENPPPSVAEIEPERLTFYLLEGQRDRKGAPFVLIRHGITKLHRDMEPVRGNFPTAGSPHPLCPAHTYVPPASHRPTQRMKKPLPSHLRVVA